MEQLASSFRSQPPTLVNREQADVVTVLTSVLSAAHNTRAFHMRGGDLSAP